MFLGPTKRIRKVLESATDGNKWQPQNFVLFAYFENREFEKACKGILDYYDKNLLFRSQKRFGKVLECATHCKVWQPQNFVLFAYFENREFEKACKGILDYYDENLLF